MSNERWPYFAAIASIMLAISVAYLVERKCKSELAFQRRRLPLRVNLRKTQCDKCLPSYA
jgi:hypothetical protein